MTRTEAYRRARETALATGKPQAVLCLSLLVWEFRDYRPGDESDARFWAVVTPEAAQLEEEKDDD